MRVRWCAWQGSMPATLKAVSGRESFDFSGFRLAEFTFPDDQLRAAQADSAVIVFQGLETDASRIPQGRKDWLSARNVTIAPGDRVIDLLRKMRNATGLTAEDIDISPSG